MEYVLYVFYDQKNNFIVVGLTGKTDERDREYIKLRIPKSELYSMWKNQRGETQDFERMSISDNYSNNSKYRGDLGHYYNGNYRDNYGNTAGYKRGTFNNYDPVNMFTKFSILLKLGILLSKTYRMNLKFFIIFI